MLRKTQMGLQKAITPSITSYVQNIVYDKDFLQTDTFWKDDILVEIKCSMINSLKHNWPNQYLF